MVSKQLLCTVFQAECQEKAASGDAVSDIGAHFSDGLTVEEQAGLKPGLRRLLIVEQKKNYPIAGWASAQKNFGEIAG